MTDEELEFSISQYVDGTLAAADRASLERLMSDDTNATAMLADYRKLNVILKSDIGLPKIDWDSFSGRISAAVDAADAQNEDEIAQRFRMPGWARSALIPLTLAASVLIATGVAFHAMQTRLHSPANNLAVHVQPTAEQPSFASVSVFGSRSDSNPETSESQVVIGPSADAKDQPILVHYSGDLVSRSSRVAVASGVTPVHDADSLSYDMQ